MRTEKRIVGGAPALLWGEPAEGIYLFIHGQDGYKEEAEPFAALAAARGRQVLSVDLPGHGERKNKGETLLPWMAVPELQAVMEYAARGWKRVAVRANSIGAWLSMLAFGRARLEKCLFVSPVLDMERLIHNMMGWAGVTEAELAERREIETDFGQTLSWEYLQYARARAIGTWEAPTEILYAGRDNLVERETVDAFAGRFGCGLTVVEEGEHWFHTPEQRTVLEEWTRKNL